MLEGKNIKTIKHNKIKNTGLIFEILNSYLVYCILNNKLNESEKIYNLINTYFSPNKSDDKSNELYKEFKLYDSLMSAKFDNELMASEYINSILEARKKINNKILEKQRYNLINSLIKLYNNKEKIKDIFKLKINSDRYKKLANIYKLFASHFNINNIDHNIIFESKKAVLNDLIKNQDENKDGINKINNLIELIKNDKDIMFLSYKLMIDKFNKKYNKLNEEQKEILKFYINNSSNSKEIKEFIDYNINKLKNKFKFIINNNNIDAAMKIKIKEFVKTFNKMKKYENINENIIESLLLSYELINKLEEFLKYENK